MAWSWSHTDEAYANARANFFDLPDADLIAIAGEWEVDRAFAHKYPCHDQFLRAYKNGAKRAWRLISCGLREELCDELWTKIEALATCTNGGWEAYVCPDGCHRVPFDRTRSNDD